MGQVKAHATVNYSSGRDTFVEEPSPSEVCQRRRSAAGQKIECDIPRRSYAVIMPATTLAEQHASALASRAAAAVSVVPFLQGGRGVGRGFPDPGESLDSTWGR